MLWLEETEGFQKNGWEGYNYSKRTKYEIEESDVGVTRQHYLGFNYSMYTFKKEDVGRVIVVTTYLKDNCQPYDMYYGNWVFTK